MSIKIDEIKICNTDFPKTDMSFLLAEMKAAGSTLYNVLLNGIMCCMKKLAEAPKRKILCCIEI